MAHSILFSFGDFRALGEGFTRNTKNQIPPSSCLWLALLGCHLALALRSDVSLDKSFSPSTVSCCPHWKGWGWFLKSLPMHLLRINYPPSVHGLHVSMVFIIRGLSPACFISPPEAEAPHGVLFIQEKGAAGRQREEEISQARKMSAGEWQPLVLTLHWRNTIIRK